MQKQGKKNKARVTVMLDADLVDHFSGVQGDFSFSWFVNRALSLYRVSEISINDLAAIMQLTTTDGDLLKQFAEEEEEQDDGR